MARQNHVSRTRCKQLRLNRPSLPWQRREARSCRAPITTSGEGGHAEFHHRSGLSIRIAIATNRNHPNVRSWHALALQLSDTSVAQGRDYSFIPPRVDDRNTHAVRFKPRCRRYSFDGFCHPGKNPGNRYVTPGPTFDDTPVSACSSSEFLALWLFALCQTGVRLELSICSNKSNSSLAAVIPMLYRKLPRRPASLRRWVSTVSKPFFVTTPIFYVNGDPHLGHLFSSMLAE